MMTPATLSTIVMACTYMPPSGMELISLQNPRNTCRALDIEKKYTIKKSVLGEENIAEKPATREADSMVSRLSEIGEICQHEKYDAATRDSLD